MAVRRTITWLAVLAVLLTGTGTATLLHATTHAVDASTPTAMGCTNGCPVDSSDSGPADDHEGDDCPTCDFLSSLAVAPATPPSVVVVDPDGIWLASVVQAIGTRDVRFRQARAPPITIA